jgi:hypothetical protein
MASKVTFSGALYTNRHTFQLAGTRLTQKAKRAVLQAADMYLDSLNMMLDMGQKIWGIPDTPYYRRKKYYYLARHGLPDAGPWVKSGELRSHLGTFVTQDGSKRFRAWAGFEEGQHSSGMSVTEMVEWLDADYPLIEPAWQRIEPRVTRMLLEIGEGIFR